MPAPVLHPAASDHWQGQLLRQVHAAVKSDPFWAKYFVAKAFAPRQLHLAVLTEPYLRLILEGRKTVESRFSRVRKPPYESASAGDAILLKRSSGPVIGICRIDRAWFHVLDDVTRQRIRRDFSRKLCTPDEFWAQTAQTAYASLFELSHVLPLPDLICRKRDQRGWVTL